MVYSVIVVLKYHKYAYTNDTGRETFFFFLIKLLLFHRVFVCWKFSEQINCFLELLRQENYDFELDCFRKEHFEKYLF